MGNALVDLAAGIDVTEAAVDYATVDYVDRIDAVSVKLLKRLVALGIRAAEVPRARPAKAVRCKAPDLAALVSSSQHDLVKGNSGGFTCRTCRINLTRSNLRKGGLS